MKVTEYLSGSKEETAKIAEDLAKTFQGGEVIFAYGPLGAGKTAFCKGLGKAIGVKGIINSPTFDLIKVYDGTDKQLYHVDCYRLENCKEERKDLSLDEIVGEKDVITYVEWPRYASKWLLEYHPRIEVTRTYIDEEKRKITIKDDRF